MERHLNVCYVDSQCNKHCLETERIDLYVFSQTCDDIIIELKAIQRSIQEPERVQIKKYFKEVLTVFICNDFPEFSTDLVTTLSCLDVNEFSHYSF